MTVKISQLEPDNELSPEDLFIIVDELGVSKSMTGQILLDKFVAEAPLDTTFYFRKDGAWVQADTTTLPVTNLVATLNVSAATLTTSGNADVGGTLVAGSAAIGDGTNGMLVDPHGLLTFAGTADTQNALAMTAKTFNGFDRDNPLTLGVIQYCQNAASGEVVYIDQNMVSNTLTGQTYFSDGVTLLTDRTIAHCAVVGEPDTHYWCEGTYAAHSACKTVQLDNTGSLCAICYNCDGDLVVTSNPYEAIVELCILSIIVNNPDTGQNVSISDERHGINMDAMTHYHFHTAFHTRWGKIGCEILGLATGSGIFTGVSAGIIYDEDIKLDLASVLTAPTLHKTGANGYWTLEDDNNNAFKEVGGALVFNEYTGTTWQLTPVASGDYVIMGLLATGDIRYPYMKIIGQEEFPLRSDARKALPQGLHNILMTGLPVAETVPLAAWIVKQGTNVLEKGADGEVYVDLRYGHPTAIY